MSTAPTTLPEGWEDLGPAPSSPELTGVPLPDGWQDLGPAEGVDLGPAEDEAKVTPLNYGRIAAARIALARRKARATGADLNINQQAAIMDAYRQGAGLPTLSNTDTFKEAQRHIAAHQSDVLNLARATSSAFMNQAVNFVAPATDAIFGGTTLSGTWLRANIAATNPFDTDRISGKAGGIVASMPLILAGGGPKAAAAIFGLQTMTDSLATATDTGVTGVKKWAGSAGQGAITAASVLIGGKIAEWAGKSLVSELPAIEKLLASGQTAAAVSVVTREAALAGISLPADVASQVVGQIGVNLTAAASTDPNRKWDDGLLEATFMAVGMRIGTHIARAGAGVAGVRKAGVAQAEAEQAEAGPRLEDMGPRVEGTGYFPIVRLQQGGPLATIPKKPTIIPVDSGKTYSQAGPDLPRVLVTPPEAGQLTPEQSAEYAARAARQAPEIPPTPGAEFPLVRSGGPLVHQPRPPAVIPVDRGRTYSPPSPPTPRVISPMPQAEQITPAQTLEEVAIAGRQAPRRTLIPGGGPLVLRPTNTALLSLRPPAEPTPTQTMEVLNSAIRDSQPEPPPVVGPRPESYPDGVVPTIHAGQKIPSTGGTGENPDTVHVSDALPQHLEIDGQVVDVHSFVAIHEQVERRVMDAGGTYEGDSNRPPAHAIATAAEHAALRAAGVDPVAYEQALAPHEKLAGEARIEDAPPDLDGRPYLREPPVLPRPGSVVMSEADIHRTPDGVRVNTPHATYGTAEYMARGADLGAAIPDTGAGENLWVRPSAEPTNAKRVLLMQFSTNLINKDRPRTAADDYYDKLYSNRPGYSRPADFWELPQWIGVAAHNLPNADVYVVRNMAEAASFLQKAGYGEVAFSALDVNSPLIQTLLAGYRGKVAIGGYTDMAPFKGKPGVAVYEGMADWIKTHGQKFEDGTDYRHFRKTETQPRLQLSSGCLHKCGFCSMPRTIVKTTPEGVAQQIKSFGDLSYRLVYLNDKTFGQADNYADLVAINKQLQAANPDFEGFIIQTTASQMLKFTPEFLRDSGIKYVELGVESYNDSILKPLHKPANEAIIDKATDVIRKAGMKLIPNIIVGIPDETAASYARTQDYLQRNIDVISHVNVNNLAAYAGTELTAKIGKVEAGDVNQNVTARSFHKDPALHQAAYEGFTQIGDTALGNPGATAPGRKAPAAEPEPGLLQKLHEEESGATPFSHLATAAGRVVRPIASLANDITGEMAWSVSHLPAGQALVRGLDWVSNRAASLVGLVANPAADAYQALPRADRKWLAATDAAGYSNFQRLLEDTPSGRLTPSSPGVQRIADVYRQMLDVTGREAMRVGVQAIAPDGTVVDFRQASSGRYLRSLTPDALQAIHQGHGPLFDAIANVVARDNKIDLAQAGQFLREWLGPESVRRIGQIERLRAIKFMPTTVEIAGEKVAIQETDPFLAIMGNARRQAKRIYFIERFGQNVKGAPTHIERMRSEFQKGGGNTKTFDDLVSVFEDRPYKRVFDDPRSMFSRAVRVADTFVATAQTSLSAIPNLPQTMILVPKYVGPINFFKAIADVIRHPKITAAQLSAVGAMNRAVIDWSLRPGHGPEDFARIVRGVVARATGLEAISQFNNQVSGMGFYRLAKGWAQHGIRAGDVAVARDLRLTPQEIAAVNAGQFTTEIRDKIIQNGVKITQFITEDPHRMSKWQHIPLINGLIAYNNYAIGTAKAVMRTSRDVALAINSQDPKQMTAAAGRIVMLLAGAVGAGTISVMLRRAAKGQAVVQSGEDAEAILQKALWEVAILGPAQRMHDTFDYSGGSTEKAMIGISPKLSAVALVLAGLRGGGRWGELPAGERAAKAVKQMTPVVRAFDTWWDRVAYPQVHTYSQVRSMAATYRPKDGPSPDVPVNPIYFHIHQAILREDGHELQQALDAHKEWATSQGWEPKDARRRLRSALSARRPVNFNYPTYREFLASLPEDKRRLVGDIQLQYTEAVDNLTLTPEELAARTGDIGPLRAAVGRGEMGRPAATKIVESARQKPLQRQLESASFPDAMRIWKLAPPEERSLIRRQVLEKARRQAQVVPKDGGKIVARLKAEGVLP